jgi:hypothetical protein
MNNIEQLVHRILSGKNIFKYDCRLYELQKPSLDLKIQADLIYQDCYELNLYSGFILEKDRDSFLISNHIVSPFYNDNIKNEEKKLEKIKITLYKNYFDLNQRRQNKTKIEAAKSSIAKLYLEKHFIDFLILEKYAENAKNEFILCNTLFNYNTKKLVFSYPDVDYVMLNNFTNCIAINSIDMSKYKEIARSQYWRNYYSYNKTNLLPYPATEYSDEQIALISVSEMYSKIHEHPECPNEEIINDDDALDGWMLLQQEENKKQKQEKGVSHMMSNKAAKKSQEVFLMANGNKEQTKNILELNSEEGLNKIKTRIDSVKDSNSPIKDSALSDVKTQLRNKIQELNQKNRK